MKYKRIVLKLSGEALQGEEASGIDFSVMGKLASEIEEIHKLGVQIVIIIGAGNFWRYRDKKGTGIDRVTSDHMGMTATILNAVAMRSALIEKGMKARVLSTWNIPQITQPYLREVALGAMQKNEIILCAGGTGSPFFTTDTAAAIRGLELNCDIFLKATKVDGVYDKDPEKFDDAKRYDELSYEEALTKNLKVMDATAVSLCRDGGLTLKVFNVEIPGNIKRVVEGEDIGTLIH